MMASTSPIDEQFDAACNELCKLYNSDQLEKCIEQAKLLLDDPAIPRFHRIKTLFMLASTLGDWYEAERHRAHGELLWRIARHWNPAGQDAELDEAMNELRDLHDELKKGLDAEKPANDDFEVVMAEELAAYEAEMAEQQALADAENDDPKELAKADAAALGLGRTQTTPAAIKHLTVGHAIAECTDSTADCPAPAVRVSGSRSRVEKSSMTGSNPSNGLSSRFCRGCCIER